MRSPSLVNQLPRESAASARRSEGSSEATGNSQAGSGDHGVIGVEWAGLCVSAGRALFLRHFRGSLFDFQALNRPERFSGLRMARTHARPDTFADLTEVVPPVRSDQLLALGAWRVLRPFCPHRVREGLRFGRRLNGLRWSARIIVRRCSVLRWPFAPPNPFPVIGTVLFPVSPPGSGQGSSIFMRVRTGYR